MGWTWAPCTLRSGLWALERVARRVVRLESAVVCVTRSAYWKALPSTVSRPSDVPEFLYRGRGG